MPKNTQNDRLKKTCELYVLNAIKEPQENYTFERAMIEAGYSPQYARKNSYLVRARIGTQDLINAEKAKLEARQLWDLEQIEAEFIEQYIKADQSADRTNALRALESLMKRHGGYREDAPNPESELQRRKYVENETIELRRLAQRRIDEISLGLTDKGAENDE